MRRRIRRSDRGSKSHDVSPSAEYPPDAFQPALRGQKLIWQALQSSSRAR